MPTIPKEDLIDFRNRLLNFSKGNTLFHLTDQSWVKEDDRGNEFQEEISGQDLEKLFRKGNPYEKATGISPWKLTFGTLSWWDVRKKEAVTSPVFLKDGLLEKVKGPVVRFRFRSESTWFLNPALVYYFEEVYGIKFNIGDKEEKQTLLNNFSELLKTRIRGLELSSQSSETTPLAWQLQSIGGIGVFNTGAYAFLHDYQRFIDSDLSPEFHLQQGQFEKKNEIPGFLQRPDPSQLKVLTECSQGNSTLITGPPGTGKSALIVNIIADALIKQKRVLFVSEKKTALDVVYNQLDDKGFGTLCSYFHHRQQGGVWIENLRKSFEFFRDNKQGFSGKHYEYLRNELVYYTSFFQHFSGTLTEKIKDTGGISVQELILQSIQEKDLIFSELIHELEALNISVKQINENEHQLKQLEKQIKAILPYKHCLVKLKSSFFMEQEDAEVGLRKHIEQIVSAKKTFNKIFKTLPETSFLRELSIAANTMSLHFNAYKKIFSSENDQAKFLKWGHEILALKKSLKTYETVLQITRELPNPSQLKDLQKKVSSKNLWGTVFSRRRQHRLIPHLSKIKAASAKIDYLERLVAYQEKKLQLAEKEARFRTKFELAVSDAELEMMLAGVERMNRYHRAVNYIIQQENSEVFIEQLKAAGNDIEKFHRSMIALFGHDALDWKEDEVVKELDSLQKVEGLLDSVWAIMRTIEKKDRNLFLALLLAESLKVLQANTTYLHLKNHLKYKSAFTGTYSSDHQEKILLYNRKIKDYSKSVKEYVLKKFQDDINAFFLLTDQSSRQTSVEEKPLRKALQQGKRILFHEFSKSMRHKSPFEMMETDASLWIKTLQPIWIMNTLSVSEYLPLEKDLFDIVIFDESSQIPVEHAIPAIYRGNQVIIVGDEQQMPPKQFFTATIGEDDYKEISLMSYFKPLLKDFSLQWHYRSKDERLIAFSNRYFYQNSLIPLPNSKIIDSEAVKHTYLPEGRFISRKNEVEAKAIADFLNKNPFKNETVALVCFSEEQAALMEKAISDRENVQVMSLGQVQGEEYNHVIISLAYGKNEDGHFRYYLGPLSQENGKKRLNVLMSRAKKSMHLFHSVMPQDFEKKYENPGIEMLYRMLCFFTENENLKKTKDLSDGMESKTKTYPEPLGEVVQTKDGIVWKDIFGHHEKVVENPLNEGFVQHLFEELKEKIIVLPLKEEWENILKETVVSVSGK